MTDTTLTSPNLELSQHHIIQQLQQLTIAYQQAKLELQNLPLEASSEEFTLSEEIELLTTEIRGYASQIKFTGTIENPKQATEILHRRRLLEIPIITQFYFQKEIESTHLKSYLQNLDYLRLLILEYLKITDIAFLE